MFDIMLFINSVSKSSFQSKLKGQWVVWCQAIFVRAIIFRFLQVHPFNICEICVFFRTFLGFGPVERSPAAEILHATLFAPLDHYKNKESEIEWLFLLKTTWIFRCVYWATKKSPATQLHRTSQMKPPDPKNAKKSVIFGYFPGKRCRNTLFQHPQQLMLQSTNPKYS